MTGEMYLSNTLLLLAGNIATEDLGLDPVDDDEDTVASWNISQY